MFKKLAMGGVVCALLGVSASASAEPIKDEPAPKKLEWRYSRFRTSEYVVTGVLLSGVVASQLLAPKEDSTGTWKGPILVDGGVASAMRASTPESRERAANISDYLLYGMIAFPFLDAAYAATVRRSPDVAWQMTLINTQAFALTGLTTFAIKSLTNRERPWTSSCDPATDATCKSNDSFLSGHASMAFTSAGLTCAHHQALKLYGNPAADVSACLLSFAAATATGSLRILADRHYASDVFAGAAIGVASGYVLPMLLHYRNGAPKPSDSAKHKEKSFAWTAAPTATRTGAGVALTGVF